jgi:SAM-dependent methyltransferase
MTGSDALFAGSVPETYERLLVPLIFEFYAADLADRLRALEPADVLEIAAGTGVVTRAIAHAHPRVRIVATDLNQSMLDQAMARQPVGDRITWRQADAQALPFDDETFDAVVCQFGAMFFPDRTKAYREARRVLRPGGCFLFNVWDRLSENEFACVVTEALASFFLDDPPDFLGRTPYGYHNVQTIREELAAAGFAGTTVDTIENKSRAPTAKDAATAFCQGTPLRSEIEARAALRLDEATEAAAEAVVRRFGPGPVEARIQAHVVTTTR